MRTKICLPNSPKKSLKHFVILKCLENELEALKGLLGWCVSISYGSWFSNSVTAGDVPSPLRSWGGWVGNERRDDLPAPRVWGAGPEGT